MISLRSDSPLQWLRPTSGLTSTFAPSRWYQADKRILDLLITIPMLMLIAPVWLLIAAAIRLDSPGPVLLRQVRIGRNGRPFVCYKFRTMHANCDDSLHRRYVAQLIKNGAPSDVDGGKEHYKLRDDPRVTRVGRILRKTSLDELPQFLNVLRGDMSLVGPRPPLPYEVEQYRPWHLGRLNGRPGITGLWQVYGRSRVTFEQMVQMDIEYLERPSILRDIKLIFLTVPAVLFGGGAH
jgi:lipopolysaccharide/colanic/teichoic acid biosynthesis glycosyltransferase